MRIKSHVVWVLLVLVGISNIGNTAEIQPLETQLTEQERALVAWVDEHSSQMLDELKAHVDLNTGTDNIQGLNEYRALLELSLIHI